jgi:hypothetical protein
MNRRCSGAGASGEAGDVQGREPSAYKRVSPIITSNPPFSAWSEIFGDDMAAGAMVDRLVHHTELISHRSHLHYT